MKIESENKTIRDHARTKFQTMSYYIVRDYRNENSN